MEITTLLFVAFVAAVAVVYYTVPKKMQWLVLLVASVFFFAMTSAWLSFLMLATTLIIYVGALIIQNYKDKFLVLKKETPKENRKALKKKFKRKQSVVLTISVLLVLSALAFTKYFNFLGGIANSIISLFHVSNTVPVVNMILPLGISYYTLMSISYIVDVNRGTIVAEKNPLRVLLFVTYFPHIVEGPFDRYKALDEQFKKEHKFDYDSFVSACILIAYGFFKKLVIANSFGKVVPDILGKPDSSSGTLIVVGTILYTLQLYMDFSGCIDIVSGASQIFGIKVAENFRQPFFSKSIDEFWRRWHISLGEWLKDYVFYPVSLSAGFKNFNKAVSKKIKSKHLSGFLAVAVSLFFVWFCNGLWHGASGKYILYGLYYYVLMMLGKFCEPLFVKMYSKLNVKNDAKFLNAFRIVRTIIIVNVGMLLFYSATTKDFGFYIQKIFTSIDIMGVIKYVLKKNSIAIGSAASLMVLVVSILKEKGIQVRDKIVSSPFIIRWIVLIGLILTTMLVGVYGFEYQGGALYAQF